MKTTKVIISGGGTGGHIFPAIAIANALRAHDPSIEILFVGALGKMEMEKVPQAGFQIVGLPIAGFNRKQLLKNFSLPFKLFLSMFKAFRIVSSFRPSVVIGVGGYASGPTLKVANWLGISTVIQEQNSFPGKTNLLLAKKAKAICVAYNGMETFFPSDRIHLTGNPVRNDIMDLSNKRMDGIRFYGLDPNKKTIFIMGGSLGAKHINQAVVSELAVLDLNTEIQVLWQCGKGYFDSLNALSLPAHVKLLPFIERMDLAYACSDLIVSRAGATSISELTLVGKPVILVPSPNVSEDHQTKNARALSDVGAAILLPDNQVIQALWGQIEGVLCDENKQAVLVESIRKLALPNSTSDIVNICLKVMNDASR